MTARGRPPKRQDGPGAGAVPSFRGKRDFPACNAGGENFAEGEWRLLEDVRFDGRVYALVARIPRGKVVTYGQLALLLRAPRNARRVGRALHFAPPGIPCHRVVAHTGRLAPGFARQRELLEAEGVEFTEAGKVDLGRFLLRTDIEF